MTKIITISDTHNQHEEIYIEDCDILIHSGDASTHGTESELVNFFEWFKAQPAKHKIFVPGNHDIWLENNTICDVKILIGESININGIHIYGAPWRARPKRVTSEDRVRFDGFSVLYTKIESYWDRIPNELDILITHVPPLGYLDRAEKSRRGCELLANRILNIKTKYHLFGHIHSGYGVYRLDDRILINSALCNENDLLVRNPICINYEEEKIS